jgi:hypothetical protein
MWPIPPEFLFAPSTPRFQLGDEPPIDFAVRSGKLLGRCAEVMNGVDREGAELRDAGL